MPSPTVGKTQLAFGCRVVLGEADQRGYSGDDAKQTCVELIRYKARTYPPENRVMEEMHKSVYQRWRQTLMDSCFGTCFKLFGVQRKRPSPEYGGDITCEGEPNSRDSQVDPKSYESVCFFSLDSDFQARRGEVSRVAPGCGFQAAGFHGSALVQLLREA